MSRVHEREVIVAIPMGIGRPFVAALVLLVLAAVAILLGVITAFPATEYSNVPTTRELGPCEPFCSLRTTTPSAPVGGEQR
ncbi:hypothetical protein [Nocardia xishanensis]